MSSFRFFVLCFTETPVLRFAFPALLRTILLFPSKNQIFKVLSQIHSVHPPPLSAGWGGGLASNQIFKKGGLDKTSTFRGGCWERGDDFFQGAGWGGGVGGLQYSQIN